MSYLYVAGPVSEAAFLRFIGLFVEPIEGGQGKSGGFWLVSEDFGPSGGIQRR